MVPYQSIPANEGQVNIAVGNDGQFPKLAAELGHAEWAQDARFSSNAARVENRHALIPLIQAETAKRSMAELIAAMEQRGVPCGPINTIDKVFADPHVAARQLRRDVPHSQQGSVPSVASPLRLSDSPVSYDRGPPLLGEHTDEVLAEQLGLDAARLAELRSKGII